MPWKILTDCCLNILLQLWAGICVLTSGHSSANLSSVPAAVTAGMHINLLVGKKSHYSIKKIQISLIRNDNALKLLNTLRALHRQTLTKKQSSWSIVCPNTISGHFDVHLGRNRIRVRLWILDQLLANSMVFNNEKVKVIQSCLTLCDPAD